MGQVRNIIEEWCVGDPEKEEYYAQRPGQVLRWINEGQLRYASKSEILRTVWTPTITSSGNIALPTDFLREFPDRVKYDDNRSLTKINYEDANLVSWSTTTHYSIYGETFYVWVAGACTPSIPYIKRPSTITFANINTADFDALLPPEFDHTLRLYLESEFQSKKKPADGLALLSAFDEQARQDGHEYNRRHSTMPRIRPSIL